jgi:hypothetical protein
MEENVGPQERGQSKEETRKRKEGKHIQDKNRDLNEPTVGEIM